MSDTSRKALEDVFQALDHLSPGSLDDPRPDTGRRSSFMSTPLAVGASAFIAVLLLGFIALLPRIVGEPESSESPTVASPPNLSVSSTSVSSTNQPSSTPQVFEYVGLVIEDPDGAVVCGGLILYSYPPQCGDSLPVTGVDWSQIGSAESEGETTWATLALAGTLSDAGLELTRPPREPDLDGTEHSLVRRPFASPPGSPVIGCPVPEGGWRVRDPHRASSEALAELHAYVSELPGYLTMYLKPLGSARVLTGPRFEPIAAVATVVFDEGSSYDNSRLATLYGGPLCVDTIRDPVGVADYEEIAQRLGQLLTSDDARRAGIHPIEGGAYYLMLDNGAMLAEVWGFDDEISQRWIAAHFETTDVVLDGRLTSSS